MSRFFEKAFLLADISIDITLSISFFTLSNVKIGFINGQLHWKTYTVTKAFPMMSQIKLIRKKEFANTTLDLEDEAFVVHVTSISQN